MRLSEITHFDLEDIDGDGRSRPWAPVDDQVEPEPEQRRVLAQVAVGAAVMVTSALVLGWLSIALLGVLAD